MFRINSVLTPAGSFEETNTPQVTADLFSINHIFNL